MTGEKDIQRIDIKEVIRQKNPVLLKYLPGLVLNLIRRILHEDEVNRTLREHHSLKGLDFTDAVLRDLGVRYSEQGLLKLGTEEKYVFASNHPLGGIEGMVLTSLIGHRFGKIRVPVNDILYSIRNFRDIFVPINKHGSNSRDFFKLYDELYASENQILMFPAGFVSRKSKGVIVDAAWERSFLKKAIQYQRNVVPVLVQGRNSRFFYNLASLRKFLRIKANIEMFFLPDEMFKMSKRPIMIYFGRPVPYTFFDSSMGMNEWADMLRKYVYCLPDRDVPNFQEWVNIHKNMQ